MWFDKTALSLMVFDAVHSVEWASTARDNPAALPLSSTPHPVLRSLLLYGLAVGWTSSREIAFACREDAMARYLAASFTPTEAELRQFRRDNREPIQRALAHLFAAALAKRPPHAGPSAPWPAAPRSDLHVAAAARFQKAVRADSRSLDD